MLYHTADGGSLNAFTPYTKGTELARVKYVGTSTCGTSVSYTDSTNAENNATIIRGCQQVGNKLPADGVATAASNATNAAALIADANGPRKPVGGFSDVEPAVLPASLGGGDVSAFGSVAPAYFTQAFGVVVSKPLYRALQVAQGIANNTDALDPNYDPANAPTITKAQYTSIICQGGAYHTDWSPILGATGTGKAVKLFRRVNSSGTQASSNAYFLANPCATAVAGNYNPASAADTVAGSFEVTEGAGTGDVLSGITTAGNAGGYAIGVVSAENDWRTASTANNGFRFVELDGVHPEAGDTTNARATLVSGQYEFAMESVAFTASGLTGFGSTILADIVTGITNPPSTAACNVLPRGLALNPLGSYNPAFCSVGAQVTKVTNLGNSCSPLQLVQ